MITMPRLLDLKVLTKVVIAAMTTTMSILLKLVFSESIFKDAGHAHEQSLFIVEEEDYDTRSYLHVLT